MITYGFRRVVYSRDSIVRPLRYFPSFCGGAENRSFVRGSFLLLLSHRWELPFMSRASFVLNSSSATVSETFPGTLGGTSTV